MFAENINHIVKEFYENIIYPDKRVYYRNTATRFGMHEKPSGKICVQVY